MGDNNWVVQNLQNSLEMWNVKLAEIWGLLTQSPQNFKGGAIWNVILDIHGALQSIGFALLVLFFVTGIMKSFGNISEIKRPENAIRIFIRFVIAKIILTYSLDLLLSIFKIIQGIISTIMKSSGIGNITATILPNEVIKAIENCNFFESIPLWAITLIGGLFITVLSFVMIMTVYGRFFKLYLYTAISPIPLSTFVSENVQNIGKSFLKSYCAVCLEGAMIVLACVIFSLFASSPPVIDINAAAVAQVWKYIAELIFNMLVLVGTIKLADRVVREMMGL